MLRYFWENDLVCYSEKEIHTWQEAVTESCQLLLQQGCISETYIAEIIRSVEDHGPYIIIAPNVAMPHASGESTGVFTTAISFTRLKKPVSFGSSDKMAQLFFTLVAKDLNEHLENIQNLMELLMKDGIIERLSATKNLEEYQTLMQIYAS